LNVIACDLGGTHARFALVALEPSSTTAHRFIHSGTLNCADYRNFNQALEHFLDEASARPQAACVAAAGPVNTRQLQSGCQQTIQLTNLPWRLDSQEINTRFGLTHTYLLNDFAALVFAVSGDCTLELQPVHTVTDRPNNACEDTTPPFLVLGPGTGLGAAVGIRNAGSVLPLNTEAGHSLFGPTNREQIALLDYLLARQREPSWETLVSGPGLSLLYDFIIAQQHDASPAGTQRLDAKEIVAQGISTPGSPAQRTLSLFLQLLGMFSRNLALSCLPTTGIYLAGGLLPRILPHLGNTDFLTGFYLFPTHRPLLEKIPISLVMDKHVGVLGALTYIKHKLAMTPQTAPA